ncbi:hypothetical protein MTR67_026229 [Solanum verrucosum]|uniref:Reverse transcriptase domain-containing protein n=1 Tax=Solanum verrucosum TaxID=315347 RepID=A0AAF0TUL4_SOLVR|nr:hypothetical protein MTR67_026229 [Solanum verrucosum]
MRMDSAKNISQQQSSQQRRHTRQFTMEGNPNLKDIPSSSQSFLPMQAVEQVQNQVNEGMQQGPVAVIHFTFNQRKSGESTEAEHNGKIHDNVTEELDLHSKVDNRAQLAPPAVGKRKTNIPQAEEITVPIKQPDTVQRKEMTKSTSQVVSGIDSMLPSPEPLVIAGIIVENVVEEAVEGLDGKVQETPTNLQEEVANGREDLSHVMHDDETDHSSDYRAPATPISSHKTTGQQSVDDSGEEEEDNNIQPPNSTLNDKWPEEVQDITSKQGLSPRDNSQLNIVRIQLQMDHAVSNINGKIWLFLSNEIIGNILENHEQHITGKFKHPDLTEQFMMSFIYAKCKDHMRRSLWDKLLFYASMEIPWCTIGDFNVITFIEEKLGGMPYNMNKIFEFIGVIEACGLTDLGYTWLPFTWCNQRDTQARVWKRLDRSMVNDKWFETMPQTTIDHLSSVGSDHSPLLMELIRINENPTKYFKFLHFWVDNASFMEIVQQCWDKGVTGKPMWKLHQKMKRLTSTLSKWSKKEHGDIYAKVKEYEETIRKSKEDLLTNNTETFRHHLHLMNANYIKYLKLEESILKPKTQLQWFKKGDANTKYFYALMRSRRRRLVLHKISIGNDVWAMPTLEELRQVVFAMNPNSAPCPDGFRENQSGFVRGRNITENIMFAQEITHGNKIPKAGANVVIKLDMTKAYDRLIMDTLGEYEHRSDQLINIEKSHFMIPDTTSINIISDIKEVTGFSQKASPITYLGCPLYIGRQRIIYYSHLVEKVSKKICGWQTRILSFGGRINLIKHALQSIPIHTKAAISPPNTTIKYVESIITHFFWGMDQDKRKYHWASMETMSLPYDKGGVGLRKLTDICTSL